MVRPPLLTPVPGTAAEDVMAQVLIWVANDGVVGQDRQTTMTVGINGINYNPDTIEIPITVIDSDRYVIAFSPNPITVGEGDSQDVNISIRPEPIDSQEVTVSLAGRGAFLQTECGW